MPKLTIDGKEVEVPPGTTVLQAAEIGMPLLAGLPLIYHPGTSWEYSLATDVTSRLVEVISGKSFDVFIKERIFDPLGMVDTGFVVPEKDRRRFVAYYAGADIMAPMKPGLTRTDDAPFPGAYIRPIARLSGGGGLVSTMPDMVALIRSLLPGGPTLPTEYAPLCPAAHLSPTPPATQSAQSGAAGLVCPRRDRCDAAASTPGGPAVPDRVKTLGDDLTGADPKFLGPQIAITGDGRQSWGP